jgi:hypothetical protein
LLEVGILLIGGYVDGIDDLLFAGGLFGWVIEGEGVIGFC